MLRRRSTLVFWLLLAGCEPRTARAPAPSGGASLRHVPIGLCEDYPEESRSLDEVRRDLEWVKNAGGGVLRVSLGWDELEPERDRYDFAFWDRFVELAGELDVQLLPYVAYTPEWLSDGAPEDFWKTPPRDNAEFSQIMGLLAERYRGRITSWEIWNEPDNRDYWLGSASQYAALVAAGARAVRAADPRAKIVLGGLAGGVEFLRALFDEHGVSAHVDVVNLHSYYETWNPERLESIAGYVGEVGEVVARHGGRQSLWMAEVGYSNFGAAEGGPSGAFTYEHTAPFQAVMLVRTLALLLSEPALSLVAWYELKDARRGDAVIGDDHNRHLGILHADYRPKPALGALGFVRALFADGFRSIDREVHVREGHADRVLRAFLTGRGTIVVIAWLANPRASEAPPAMDARHARLSVTVPYEARGAATLRDELGRALPTPLVRGSDGATTGEIELRGGQVRVLELPVGGASGVR